MSELKLPFEVVLVREDVLKHAYIINSDKKCIANDASTDDKEIIRVFNEYKEIVTAVNEYPALKAENEKLRDIINKISEIVDENIYSDKDELLLCVSDIRGRHYLSKDIKDIVNPALEGCE